MLVRPLLRQHDGNPLVATPPDKTSPWQEGKRRLRAQEWNGLVLPDQKPGAAAFRVVAIFDPRYKEPLLLATNLSVSAQALWRLYRDRWAVEQVPLAAKPMRGAARWFVSGSQSRFRLPELALLAGSLLS